MHKELIIVGEGPVEGRLGELQIPSWIHLADGRICNFDGVRDENSVEPLSDKEVLMKGCLVYREDPKRRGQTLEDMERLVAKQEACRANGAALAQLAREVVSDDLEALLDEDAVFYPLLESDVVWVGRHMTVSAEGPEQARQAAIAMNFQRPGEIEVEKAYPSGESDNEWRVLFLVKVQP